MRLNPELQRNLWVELSATRLIAAPLALAAALLLGYQLRSEAGLALAAEVLFFFIAVLWGTRRAAAALGDEVTAATWDGQRMSALGAWQLGWGKLLGSTAFIWYCALPCLAVGFWAESQWLGPEVAVGKLLLRLFSALLAQSVALASCLVFLRKLRPTRRVPVTLSQGLGILAGFAGQGPLQELRNWAEGGRALEFIWYGRSFVIPDFVLAAKALFLAWAFLGIYRLMRAELQFPTGPWAWAAFTVFLAGFFQGFAVTGVPAAGGGLAPAFAAAAVMIYAGLFLEQKSTVTYRALGRALKAREWRAALHRFPLWATSALLALPLGVLVAVLPDAGLSIHDARASGGARIVQASPLWVPTVLLLTLRDVAVVLFLNFGRRRRRADLAGVCYLVVVYGLVPPILFAFELGRAVLFVVPLPDQDMALPLAAALGQALAVAVAVRWRLHADEGEDGRASP